MDGSFAAQPAGTSVWQALVLAAARAGVALSAEQLTRDHGAATGKASLKDLGRVAGQCGLVAKPASLTFKSLAAMDAAVGVLIQLTDGRLLLLDRPMQTQSTLQLVLREPGSADNSRILVDELTLSQCWQGQALLVKAAAASDQAIEPFSFGWMLKRVLQERQLCRDILLASFTLGLLGLLPPLLYMVVIDRVLVHHRLSTLITIVIAIAVVLLFDMLLGSLRRTMTAVATARIEVRVNLHVFDRLSRLPMQFFEQNATGGVVHRIGEARRVRSFVTNLLFGTVLDTATLLVLVPAMFLLNPVLALWVCAIGLIMALIIVVYMGPVRRAYGRVMQAEQKRASHLIETIHGIRTIKSLALEGAKRREWDAQVAESAKAQTDLLTLANQPQTLLAPLEKLIYAGSLCIGSWMAINEQHVVLSGSLVAFTMIATRATQPLVQLAGMMQQFEEARSALRQVASIVNLPAEGQRTNGARPEIKGRITFDSVHFTYAGASAPALSELSTDIQPGSLVGIMGRSGSGKTTITRLLQGLNSDYSGTIRLDGVDLKEIDLQHLRMNVGVVLQDSFLFRGTIRDNIMVGKIDATPEEMLEAAAMAGADEFIEQLPRGFDTMIEENASNLSGGQRQRLAIARALISNPKILIFDEATSALDPDSEAIITDNLKLMAKGRTVLMVSHRLSSLVDCDQILVMAQGRLRDQGRHAELMRRSTDYRHLWNRQNRHLTTDMIHDRPRLDPVA